MESAIAKALHLTHEPVALIWSDQKPEGALQFAKGRWGCVMAVFSVVVERGQVAAFDRETYGCQGGGVGLGFGNCYDTFLGGLDGFCGFLSTGNEATEPGRAACAVAEKALRGSMLEHFKHGERYRKSPAAVRKFVSALPMMEVPTRYVIFKQLAAVTAAERVVGVVFLANPDQLSALTLLANYDSEDQESVIMPQAAGCQSIGIYLYREMGKDHPRAVAGLNDITARKALRRLGTDLMTFAVPLELYAQMERAVPGSFVEGGSWRDLQDQAAH
jgi:uncharacterized protein (DUF169 family)